MAKYKDIVKDIEGCIRRGDLQPYDQLPTVVEMTKAYHVSRTTIEQVMDELEKRGLVSRKRGSGVYVKKVATQSFDKPLNTISLTDDIDVALHKLAVTSSLWTVCTPYISHLQCFKRTWQIICIICIISGKREC